MSVERIPVEAVRVWDRLRTLVPDKVDCLVASLGEMGLRTPIHVRVLDRLEEGGRIIEGVPILVAGRHRLEAARRLGWEEIDAYVLEGDERDARLWEIVENLHRAELTVQERADHIAEWVRLTGEKLQSAHNAPIESQRADGRGHRSEGGINAAVRDLGVDRTEAQRAVKIASITAEAREAADAAGLKTQKARLAIAQVAPERQMQRVAEVAASRVKPVPTPLNDIETEDQWRSAMMRLWNRAPDEWRERFIDYVQAPVFDQTRMGAA